MTSNVAECWEVEPEVRKRTMRGIFAWKQEEEEERSVTENAYHQIRHHRRIVRTAVERKGSIDRKAVAGSYVLSIEVKSRPRESFPNEIEQTIEASRSLLTLPEDWDDEGAKKIEKPTWDAAVKALRLAAQSALNFSKKPLPAPAIGPCADGTIDLYWDNAAFKLLINVRAGLDAVSDFYGEKGGFKIQGPFDPASPDFGFLRLLVE
jgi:hypothetical protein